MFEPIGGSAPKYTGKNIINPIAAISAAQIMLEIIGEPKAASWLEEGVIKVLRDDLKGVGAGKMGYSTQEVGDLVAEYIKGKEKS
jgi:3-isopropylmalate dehydrogenase